MYLHKRRASQHHTQTSSLMLVRVRANVECTRNISSSCGVPASRLVYMPTVFQQQFIPIKHLKMNRLVERGSYLGESSMCCAQSSFPHLRVLKTMFTYAAHPRLAPVLYSVSFRIYSCRPTMVIWSHVKALDCGDWRWIRVTSLRVFGCKSFLCANNSKRMCTG